MRSKNLSSKLMYSQSTQRWEWEKNLTIQTPKLILLNRNYSPAYVTSTGFKVLESSTVRCHKGGLCISMPVFSVWPEVQRIQLQPY